MYTVYDQCNSSCWSSPFYVMITRIVSACRWDDPEFLILIHRTHARTRAWRSMDQHLLLFSSPFLFSWILLPKRTCGKSAPIRTWKICSWKWKRKRVDCRSRITVLLHRRLYISHIVCLEMSVFLEECVCVCARLILKVRACTDRQPFIW